MRLSLHSNRYITIPPEAKAKIKTLVLNGDEIKVIVHRPCWGGEFYARGWVVSEYTTGKLIGEGKTIQKAITNAEARAEESFKKNGYTMQQKIDITNKKYGTLNGDDDETEVEF